MSEDTVTAGVERIRASLAALRPDPAATAHDPAAMADALGQLQERLLTSRHLYRHLVPRDGLNSENP